MALTDEQARLADEAISRVRAATVQAREAVASRSSFLTWVTGSESSEAAGRETLRQTEKIYAQLTERRPTLTADKLPGFLDLAKAGADVSDLVEASRLVSGAGFVSEVVVPTAKDLNPLNLSGPIGKVFAGAVLIAVAVLVVKLKGKT